MLSPKLTNSFCLKGSILLCNFLYRCYQRAYSKWRKREEIREPFYELNPEANLLPVEFLLY